MGVDCICVSCLWQCWVGGGSGWARPPSGTSAPRPPPQPPQPVLQQVIFIYLSTSLSLSTCLSYIWSNCLSTCLSIVLVCLLVFYLSVYLLVYLFVYLFALLSVQLFVYMFVYLFVYFSVCLFFVHSARNCTHGCSILPSGLCAFVYKMGSCLFIVLSILFYLSYCMAIPNSEICRCLSEIVLHITSLVE